MDKIVGREVVQASGGRVVASTLVPGASTTGLVRRILDRATAKPTRT